MPQITALPLFPLQAVLFPGGLLPLRIFEVRYLDMVGRCHKAGTPFGVVCLTQGTEVQRPQPLDQGSSPPGQVFAPESFLDVGTLARIDDLQRPQAGLLMIRCTGTQRFRIERSERLKHGLWTGDVDLIDDDPVVAVPEDLQPLCEALRQLVARIVQPQSDSRIDMPLQQPYRWNDCGWLANRWCELLPLKPELKHRFMALDNPLLRLELVADEMARLGFRRDA